MRKLKWLAAFLIVATLFGGILGCKQEVELPSDYTAPADVTSLTVTASNGNAVLNWKNPADTDFAGVQISMSPAEGTLKNAVSLGKDVTSLDVSGLTVGKEYTFTVKAFDKSGNESRGKKCVATVLDKTAPAEVTELTITTDNGDAFLTWQNPTDTDFAGVQISIYHSEGKLPNIILGKNATSTSVNGLTKGKEYIFTVKTFDVQSNYSMGLVIIKTISEDIFLSNVSNLTAINNADGVMLSWVDSNDKNVKAYELSWFETNAYDENVVNTINVPTGIQGYCIENLLTDIEYTFIVKSLDSVGNKSEGIAINFIPQSVISVVLIPNILEKTNQDLTIMVQVNIQYESEIKKIYYSEGNYADKTELEQVGNDITDTRQFIVPNNGTFSVLVIDTQDRNKIEKITINNIDKQAPSQVKNFVADYSDKNNTITVSWINPIDDDFIEIELEYNKINANSPTTLFFDKTTTSAVIRNITPDNSDYYITIKTKDDVGNISKEKIKTIKAIKKFEVQTGDFVLKDGRCVSKDSFSSLPKAMKTQICGVVYITETGQQMVLGLKVSERVQWGVGFAGTDYSGILSLYYNNTFTGDIDGSDNWDYLCMGDPSAVDKAATHHPPFYFASMYGTNLNLSGNYAEDWYVPTIKELNDVYVNMSMIQSSLNLLSEFFNYYDLSSDLFDHKFNFSNWWYWSSTKIQIGTTTYCQNFLDGEILYGVVDDNLLPTLVIHKFESTEFYAPPSITSITIPCVSESYTGQIPITIKGINLTSNYNLTCSDVSFGNVKYLSENEISATIACSGSVGIHAITVNCGSASFKVNYEIIEKDKCFSVGDVLFTDGTRIRAENLQYGIPDDQKDRAFAVIASAPYGGAIGKAVGLQRSSNILEWAPSGTTGYNTNFAGIQADYSGSSSSGYTFTGDLDGSDNWIEIFKVHPEGTLNAAYYYPTFNFALTYGTQAGLTGTEYENGWYVPSVAELYDVYKNRGTVQTSLNAVGGFTLGTSYYWSSSQYASNNYYASYAYSVSFSNGNVNGSYKGTSNDVLVLQAFNGEQFNDYKYPNPEITSVTVPSVGEGYTGELPVTITGKNLLGNTITCSDSSFGNVLCKSYTTVTATINYDGSNNTITVTSGTSSASTTIKVVAAEDCFSVGDIVFTDGTRIKAEDLQYGIPDSQMSKAFAVVTSTAYGGAVGKAVGLQRSASTLMWAPSGTTGYSTNFTGIQADYSGSSISGYTFSGDIDGSDNWEYICSIDPEGTKDPANNYPAFNFALTYGTQAGLTGTDYENGWYVPSVAELYDVYTNKEVVQTSLNAVGGFTLGTSNYWSSFQGASSKYYAYNVNFDDGHVFDNNKRVNYYVLVLQAFNVEQFNNYEVTPSITSVTVPSVGEGYTGELPVTIIGENLKGHAITSNDDTFTNVTYLSDTKVTATFVYNGTNDTITVTSGISSASTTIKVVAAEDCFSVGDIVFTDGTRIKAEDVQYGIPDSQMSKAFAVIASAPYGGVIGKAVGLQRSSSELQWAPSGTTGYNTNFAGIQADYSVSSSSGYTFSGDLDGSDNWEYICSIDPEDTQDAATNYSAFNFALTYGTQAGLTGTDYETGWYVPSVAELYDVYTNKEVVQTSLNAVGGFTLGTSYYWSSSQDASSNDYAYRVIFYGGVVDYGNYKYYNNYVLVLQAFNAEQFNNYEVTPSVTVATAGEGYTGELPVTIIGKNLKDNEITCSDSSFGNVTYISDTKATATITCSGVVGESTITVTIGASSANCTVKVVESEKCFTVGDIVFTDGTRIKAEDVQYGIPDSQMSKAFAVIASAPYGGAEGKAVGLQKSSSTLEWAPEYTTGYYKEFTEIQAAYSGDSSSGYTFSGDIDGSDNWESICKVDPEGTKDAATNYPVFNFALTYGTQAGLSETEYENGWYVPSVAELYDVYTNKEVVQTSLNVVGGFTLGTGYYRSSSLNASYNTCAYLVYFNNGDVSNGHKFNSYDVFVLQAFNVEQFNNYEVTPSITSVTVPSVGEGYTGELPVTIIGENLKGHAITSNDASFGNVNYVSDTKVTATFVYDGTNNAITVTSGTSKASCTVKVVAAEKCFTVGDIVFTDGTRIKAEKLQYGIPDSQISKAFAIVTSTAYGGAVGKAVGLQKSSNYLQWAPSNTNGYYKKFTEIQADLSGSSSSGYTFNGDLDGSDNWEYICSIDPEGTKDPANNYPAFNFALTYGTQAGLTGTDYETGWYVPSVTELYDVYTHREVIQTSLNAVGGFTLETSYYWSSSQNASDYDNAYNVYFNNGYVNDDSKNNYNSVFVLQAFNAEQFN